MVLRFDPREGARNLLLNCLGVRPGQRIVIAAEDPAEGFYDSFAATCILEVAAELGCGAMNGRVAVAHWLMSTANHVYEDSFLRLEEPLMAVIQEGRIADFEGPKDLVQQVRGHYRRVANLYGIEEEVVHSWHAGIHPKAFYPLSATSNIDRWGSVAFANPRYLHFHTCGNYAPGEIAWSLFDPKVELDGKVYWEEGRFTFLDNPDIRERLSRYDLDERALQQRFDIGI